MKIENKESTFALHLILKSIYKYRIIDILYIYIYIILVLVMIFIIKGFCTIVFIFIVISTMFRPICPLASFRCLSNLETFTELQTTSFIETTEISCTDSISHNWVQVLSIPVLLLACTQD